MKVGEKYTIIEMGYAVLIAENSDDHGWMSEISEIIPADGDDGRAAITGGEGWAVTSNPVVVALSHTDWWARNSAGFEPGRPIPIPTVDVARAVVKNRTILNDFHMKYRGRLPNDVEAENAS